MPEQIEYHCKLTEQQKNQVSGVYGLHAIAPRLALDGFYYCPERCKNVVGLTAEQIAVFESAERREITAADFPAPPELPVTPEE